MFSISLKNYNRKHNKDICALLAYRSGTKLYSLQDQETKYANRKPDDEIIEGFFVDAHGNETQQNRATLQKFADTTDRQERRKNSVIAKGIMLALPKELLPAKRKKLVLQFCKFISIAYKITINVNIHNEKKEKNGAGNGNHHAHLILSTRNINGMKVTELDARTGGRELTRVLRNEWAEMLNNAYKEDSIDKQVTPLSFAGRKSNESIDAESERINNAYKTLGFAKSIDSDYSFTKNDHEAPQIKHFNNPERIELNRALILHNQNIQLLLEEFEELKREWRQEKGRIKQEELDAIEAETLAMKAKADSELQPVDERGADLKEYETIHIRKSKPKNKLSLRRRLTKHKKKTMKENEKQGELQRKKHRWIDKINLKLMKVSNAAARVAAKSLANLKEGLLEDAEMLGWISRGKIEIQEEPAEPPKKTKPTKPEGMSDAQWYFGVSNETLLARHEAQREKEEQKKKAELNIKKNNPAKKLKPKRKPICQIKDDTPNL